MRDLRSKTFDVSDAGAEATEKRRNVTHAKGGKGADKHMHPAQQATVKTKSSTGPANIKGPGRAEALGRPSGVRGNKSRVGQAAPAAPSVTGNMHGSRPRKGSLSGYEGKVR